MQSLKSFVARWTIVERILALSILAACSGDKITSTTDGNHQGAPSAVDVPFCNGLEPNWVAFQDGEGAWTRVLPTIIGQRVSFRYTFTSDHGAIATVRLFHSGLTALSIQYGAPAELAVASDTNLAHCGPAITKTLLGTVAGVDANDIVNVMAGFGTRDIVPPNGNAFSLGDLVVGPQDILATRMTPANGSVALTKVILRRTPDLPDSTALPVFDFTSSEAFDPVIAHVTIAGLGPEGAHLDSRLHSAYSDDMVSFLTSSAYDATRTFYAIPENRLRDGDVQSVNITGSPAVANVLRSSAVYFRSPVDQTLTLGAPATMPALSTVATTPSLRLRATFDVQQDYDRLTAVTFQQGENTLVGVSMTAASAPTTHRGYDLTVPDLNGVAGFDARWALQPNESVFWTVTRVGGTLGLGSNATPFAGATSRTGILFGDLEP